MARRLSIYRNNSLVTHTRVLAKVFPVVYRLVGESFFGLCARQFLRVSLPTHPCLSEFGGGFPDFLRRFAPASAVRYLADVAHLEWAIACVSTGRVLPAISLSVLASRSEDGVEARLQIQPSVIYLSSPFRTDLIWDLHQQALLQVPEDFDLTSNVYLEIRSLSGSFINPLAREEWLFRSAIARGCTLGSAAEEALRIRADFDLTAAIHTLFQDELVIGCEWPLTQRTVAQRDA